MAGSAQAETRRAIGRIQRLCCAGPGGQAMLPALLAALHEVIPNSNRQFWKLDARRQLAQFYLEGPCVGVAALYLNEFYGNPARTAEVGLMSDVLHRPDGNTVADATRRFIRNDPQAFWRSDFYNAIMRPPGLMQGIYCKLPANGAPPAALNLWRTGQEPAFTRREFALLDALRGFIAHGLHDAPAGDAFDDTDDHALALTDPEGRILHLSAEAERLLLMALVPRWAPDTARQMRLDRPAELAALCRALTAATAGTPQPAPPLLRRRNAWGEFLLRAFWLGAARHVGITIERREPRALALLRRIEQLALSGREKQLCLLLARGFGIGETARAMGISAHTAITHRRNLYARLGVESRMALLDRLHTE